MFVFTVEVKEQCVSGWDNNLCLQDSVKIQGCVQKFPDWQPGARTANGTTLCH
jgi:hypothetical protein